MRKVLIAILMVVLMSLPVLADNLYERPRVRTVMDNPLIQGGSTPVESSAGSLLNPSESSPNSDAFGVRKGQVTASTGTRLITQKQGRSLIAPAKNARSPKPVESKAVILPDFKPTDTKAIIDPSFRPGEKKAIIDPLFRPTDTKAMIDPSFRPTSSRATGAVASLIDPSFKPARSKTIVDPSFKPGEKKEIIDPSFKPTENKAIIDPTYRPRKQAIIDPSFRPTSSRATGAVASIIDPSFKPGEKKEIIDPAFKPTENKAIIDPTYRPRKQAIIDPSFKPVKTSAKPIKTTSVSVPLRTASRTSAITGAAIAVPQKSDMLGSQSRAKYNAKAQTFTGTWSGSQAPWDPHVGKKVRSIDLVSK